MLMEKVTQIKEFSDTCVTKRGKMCHFSRKGALVDICANKEGLQN
jgi:hypothetical protein